MRDVVSDIVFNTTVANAGPDTAYTVLLVFTYPTALSYSRVDGGGQFSCMSDSSAGVTTCTVANVLGNGIQVCLMCLQCKMCSWWVVLFLR